MQFCFGSSYGSSVVIEAKNLDHAIRIFKVSELFPEKYVDQKFIKSSEYDSDLRRSIHKYKGDPLIYIFEVDSDKKRNKKLGSIRLKDCIDIDFRDYLPNSNLLEAPKELAQEEEEGPNLPIVTSAQALLQINSKLVLREKHDAIAKKKAELEAMVSDMNRAMFALTEEINKKKKVVYIIETYLGLQEEVVQIASGKSSDPDTPLTLFQQKLYMDEEVGICEDDGIDFSNIEEFDSWITKNIDRFAYQPKSILAWQVRRNTKDYDGADALTRAQYSTWNKQTYFLIRNGENIYRIWSNVCIGDRLFPKKLEYSDIISDEETPDSWRKDNLKKLHESYLYGLIAIQGIIERTDILGTNIRGKVNLTRPDGAPDHLVKFIRDDEPEFWLGDGRLRWRDFIKKNQESVEVGTRICRATTKRFFRMSGKDNDAWRSDPFRPAYPPSFGDVLSVIASKKDPRGNYFSHGTSYKVLYMPENEEYWDRRTWESRKRKRRVSWLFYGDEVLNVDEITLEEIDYYLQSRLDRKDYLELIPTLIWLKKFKIEENELEEEFCKMIASTLKMDYNKSNRGKIQKAISWWKLKNKWKRALTKEESTAFRMITNKLRKEK